MSETVHVLPIDDLVEHDTTDSCVCGPSSELFDTEDGDLWIVVHNSLDGREHDEPDHDKASCPRCSMQP